MAVRWSSDFIMVGARFLSRLMRGERVDTWLRREEGEMEVEVAVATAAVVERYLKESERREFEIEIERE